MIECDDTDVFLLLVCYYKVKYLSNEVYLEETTKERKIVSIRDSVDKIEREGIIITDILPVHALPGCGIVSKPCSIGKVNPLSVLKKD